MELETRLVKARLNIEFQLLSDSIESRVLEEYQVITQLHNNSIDKWLHSLQAKSGDCKCGGGSLILGEMLVHIYRKLEHIENIIIGSEVRYVPLENISHTEQLGHGVILLDSVTLQKDKQYYIRLSLPIFPARCIPLFAIAIEENILKIIKIGDRDLKDYDSYIVSVEREMLKARKSQNF